MKETGHQKPLFWIGRSYEDLLDCPDEVQLVMERLKRSEEHCRQWVEKQRKETP